MSEQTETEIEPESVAEAKPTRRVVVKRESVIVLPDVLEDDDLQTLLKTLAAFRTVKAAKVKPAVIEAWVLVGEGEGSKTQAIESFAGAPGTPDAKVGAYRAPSLSAWGGGVMYDAPPLPLVQRRALDEAGA